MTRAKTLAGKARVEAVLAEAIGIGSSEQRAAYFDQIGREDVSGSESVAMTYQRGH